MPDGDAFEAAYQRLAGTRLVPLPPAVADPARERRADLSSPARWATSSLLPRLQAIAPKRRRPRRPRLRSDG